MMVLSANAATTTGSTQRECKHCSEQTELGACTYLLMDPCVAVWCWCPWSMCADAISEAVQCNQTMQPTRCNGIVSVCAPRTNDNTTRYVQVYFVVEVLSILLMWSCTF